MSWADKLHRASFRGIPFHMMSGESPKGRRLVKHIFPGRDNPHYQDLGRTGREFTVDGYVIGDDCLEQLKALEAAAEQPGTAELVHPVYGTLIVRCSTFTPRYTSREGRVARFSMRLSEDNREAVGRVSVDTAAAVKEAASAVQEAATEEFLSTFDVARTPSHFLDRVIDTAVSAIQTINKTRLDTRSISQVQFLYNNFAKDPLALIREPVALAQLFTDIITAVSEAVTPRQRLRAGVQLIQQSAQQLERERGSVAPDTNSLALLEFTVQTAIADVADASSEADFPTYDEALQVRDDFGTAVDDASEYVSDSLYDVLYRLRSAVIHDIDTRSIDAPRIMSHVSPVTLPSVVLAYELYGDISRADELSTRNKVEHPGFMPGGVSLEVLSA